MNPSREPVAARTPATEGELHDRMKALIVECEELAGWVGPQAQVSLERAAEHVREAHDFWMDE